MTPTEPATPRRLARARAQGDVPFTADWPFAAALLGTLAVLGALGPLGLDAWQRLLRAGLAGRLEADALRELAGTFAWLLGAPALAGFALLSAQRVPGLRFMRADADPRAPRRRPPPYGRGLQWVVSALKAAVLLLAFGSLLHDSLPGLLAAGERSPAALLALLPRVLGALALRAALTLAGLGALDLIAQQAVRLRRLRMTRREVQDEQRELVGDPWILGERRARAAEQPDEQLTPQLYAARLSQLSAASLVLTGEGRAVALQYAPERGALPVLWLKAEGRESVELLARAYAVGVPLASDPLLVDDLYRLAPLAPIPLFTHARVAQLMAANVRPGARP